MDASSVENIFRVVEQLKSSAERVQNKIVEINKKIHKFNQNALLDADNLYLSFQISLLVNEKTYYSEVGRLIEEKLYNDLVRIHEKILMLITSLETLDIDHDEEKNNIMQGVRKTQTAGAVTCAEVINLVSCSLSNLELVKRFTELFNVYIERLETERRQENIHCANLTLTLNMKKKHIEIEHEKYQEQLNDLIAYFVACTDSIARQLEHRIFLLFLTSGDA